MTDFYDLPAARLENEYLAIDYLTANGPSVVRLIPAALGENLLAETPEFHLPSPYGPFRLWGGHRLWHAPETAARCYVPDTGGLTLEARPGGVHLSRDEGPTGIRRELTLTLAEGAPRATLAHRLVNTGIWAVELAPWAITQLRPGGTAVLPTGGAVDAEGLLPNRMVALWPYSRWDDPRLRLGEAAIEVVTRSPSDPFKIGYMNRAGRLEYHYGGLVFRKRWTPQPDRPHVDFGCNAEIYTNDRFIELETLGPLVTLQPGESVEHVEVWEVEPPASERPLSLSGA